ncbi:O-antigen ligase family protein [Turicibacter sanguinis]|uniref:O-antigen ligase family protein n=1 Tax=Turicibacter sanguinis TaxID=154288 RepID=UPI0018AAC610|nr:O-antigen ligase family protein [Turicibacter sanguinis]MDB8553973.1 O-antigen ligase family protein [Turicibacter sanguinis]
MEVVKEVNETSSEVVEETATKNFRTWYEKLPVKPIDILNIILIMGYLQSWMYVECVQGLGFNWDIFMTQNMCSAGMALVAAYYFVTNTTQRKATNKVIVFLISFMVISNLWSYSANRGGTWELVIFLIYSIYLKNKYTTRQFLAILTFMFTIIAILSCWYVLKYPEVKLQDGYMWKGVTGHKNSLGMAMAVGCVILLHQILNYNNKLFVKLVLFALFLLDLYVLYKTHSMTSYVATILASFIVVKHRVSPIKHIWWYIVGFIVGSFLLVFFHPILGQPIAMVTGKSPTLTGRTVIWDTCKEYFYQKPLFGYGYNGIWSRPELLESIRIQLNENLTETHNSLFDIVLQFGLVGLTLFIISLKKFCNQIKNNFKEIGLFFVVCILLIIGYGEVIPISFNSPYLIIFLYCIL